MTFSRSFDFSNKKTIAAMIVIALVVAGLAGWLFFVQDGGDQASRDQRQEEQTEQSAEDDAQEERKEGPDDRDGADGGDEGDQDVENSTQPRFKTFSGEQYKQLWYDVSLPNLRELTASPSITGSQAADQRIVNLARNKGYRLQAVPTINLAPVSGVYLQPAAKQAWQDMRSAAARDGIDLGMISGYRSVDSQRQIFLGRLGNYSQQQIANGQADGAINEILKTSSIPGYSKHHTGYAIDITDSGSGLPFEQFGSTAGYDWISRNNYLNANKFGFIPSYPEGAGAQGPQPEAWEYVWVGRDNLTN